MIGPYRIVEQIGRGGMATVYKAHQAALARYVAIKVLPEFLASEQGFRERFQQEAVAVAKLRHPNILAVYDYGEAEGVTYIVNEFVDGGELSDQLGKALPVDYATAILRQVAAALDYAHARGVLHRDIKPSNILLSRDGAPIVADFGLAKMLERSGPGLTQSGMIVGTPEYMSPEQCEGKPLDGQADLYSLAVVAYQMLTGQLPFTAATPAAVIMAQIHNQLPPPRAINPDLSSAVEMVLLKGLAKEPKERYRSAVAMVRSLEDAPREPSPPPGAVASPVPPPSSQPSFTPQAPISYPPTPLVTPLPTPGPMPGPWTQGVAGLPPRTAAETPIWVSVLLGAGGGVFLLVAAVFLAVGFAGDPSEQLGGVIVGVPMAALGLLQVGAVVGLLRAQEWGRGLAYVAGAALTLSVVGALVGIPVLIGVWRSRGASGI